MDSSSNPALRSPEDVALDLLKFVASHANLKGTTTPSTPGFTMQSAPRPEDQVTQLLDLYARCRQAVESPITSKK